MTVQFERDPVPRWWDRRGAVEACFVGRPPVGSGTEARDAAFRALRPGSVVPVAWAQQIHSDRVLSARAGLCGEGDALITRDQGLVLSVVVADCVPVLLAGEQDLAAVHAGWRGLASDILGRTLERLSEATSALTAWIGPSIGPCCYEVSEEVADAVVEASLPDVRQPGPAGRPLLDLQAAARAQLERRGVVDIRGIHCCTRCHPELLWSYRRQGPGGGRNHGFVWRS